MNLIEIVLCTFLMAAFFLQRTMSGFKLFLLENLFLVFSFTQRSILRLRLEA